MNIEKVAPDLFTTDVSTVDTGGSASSRAAYTAWLKGALGDKYEDVTGVKDASKAIRAFVQVKQGGAPAAAAAAGPKGTWDDYLDAMTDGSGQPIRKDRKSERKKLVADISRDYPALMVPDAEIKAYFGTAQIVGARAGAKEDTFERFVKSKLTADQLAVWSGKESRYTSALRHYYEWQRS